MNCSLRSSSRSWDVEGTDHWAIEPFTETDMTGPLLEESSFATVRRALLDHAT